MQTFGNTVEYRLSSIKIHIKLEVGIYSVYCTIHFIKKLA